MSLTKVLKEYRKLAVKCRKIELKSDTFLLSDSKGLCLKNLIPHSLSGRFHVVAKRGATVHDEVLINVLLRKLKNARKPVVFVWLGTCELTKKEGKYISLRQDTYQNIEDTLTEYRNLKDLIKKANKHAKVLFVECPYYSITRWNSRHISKQQANIIRSVCKVSNRDNKKLNNGYFASLKVIRRYREKREARNSKIDKQLSVAIDYYNEHLKLINKCNTPRISQDIISSCKRKNKVHIRYRKNYNLFQDGIHPLRPLIKLWSQKFLLLADKLSK